MIFQRFLRFRGPSFSWFPAFPQSWLVHFRYFLIVLYELPIYRYFPNFLYQVAIFSNISYFSVIARRSKRLSDSFAWSVHLVESAN